MVRRLFIASAIACGFTLFGVAFADTPAAAQPSDAEITDRVSRKLLEADRDAAPRIRVSTVNGVVTLEGTVLTNSQVIKATTDARRVSGVVKVENHLHVQM